MRKAHKKIKIKIAAVVFLTSAFLLAGCGGGGSSSVAPSQPSLSGGYQAAGGEAGREIAYDMDVILEGGRTAGKADGGLYSSELDNILQIKAYFEGLPDDAYNIPPVVDVVLGRVYQKRLVHITNDIAKKIEKGNYNNAYWMVVKKLLPRVDGCNGGASGDDYIVECSVKSQIYTDATKMLSVLEEAIGPGKNADNGQRQAKATDLDALKASLLSRIAQIQGYIQNADASAFSGVEADPRGTLLGVLTVAANYVIDEDLASAKETLENSFLPMVDGGVGGNASDDLIQAWVYSAAEYDIAMTLTDEMIQDVTITGITVTPASGLIEAGQTLQFTATCLYSDLVEKECNSEVAWTSDAPAVANFTAPGLLTAYSAGDATAQAAADDANSGPLPVKVVPAGVFKELFEDSYLGPDKWSDVYNSESAALTMTGGALSMKGPAYQYAEIVPSEAFYVGYGEEVVVQADLDLAGSAGGFYVQGIGMQVGNTTGLAVGLLSGNAYAQPNLYYSSPSAYGRIPTSRKATVRVVYRGGQVAVYLNDMSAPVANFNAYLDGKEVIFFLYASASGSGSQYDVLYDNYWTNQVEPGETAIKVENLTRPFQPDGSGGVLSGETLRVTVNSAPNSGRVQVGLLNTATMAYIVAPTTVFDQPTLGTYAMDFVMPASIPATKIAAVGSDDKFTNLKVHTRKIGVGGGAGRVAEGRVAAPTGPLPDFLLPEELRAK